MPSPEHPPIDHASQRDRLASAGPWWIVLGVGGVVLTMLGAPAPLLASLTLVGMGADADLGRRLAAAAADNAGALARLGGGLRWLHAAMYAVLVVVAWSALLDLVARGEGPLPRWALAADVAIAGLLLAGYVRLTRQAQAG